MSFFLDSLDSLDNNNNNKGHPPWNINDLAGVKCKLLGILSVKLFADSGDSRDICHNLRKVVLELR
jgi:hypothetical protein